MILAINFGCTPARGPANPREAATEHGLQYQVEARQRTRIFFRAIGESSKPDRCCLFEDGAIGRVAVQRIRTDFPPSGFGTLVAPG